MNTNNQSDSGIDIGSIAPHAMNPNDAVELDHLYRFLIWGYPGVGKSHFVYTMPEPICIIDTENKIHDIASKFEDSEYYLWQPTNFDQAADSLHEALDVLDAYKEQQGTVGTVAVDSMSIMWEWAQQKYVDKYHPGKKVEDVDFSGDFGKKWGKIKDFHNNKFRKLMLDSSYHICWTAMAEQDFDGEDGQLKAAGEKNNKYKMSHNIWISRIDGGPPNGSLIKSSLIKSRFTGLQYPTFESVSEVIDDIADAETAEGSISVNEVTDYDVSVMTEEPQPVKQ